MGSRREKTLETKRILKDQGKKLQQVTSQRPMLAEIALIGIGAMDIAAIDREEEEIDLVKDENSSQDNIEEIVEIADIMAIADTEGIEDTEVIEGIEGIEEKGPKDMIDTTGEIVIIEVIGMIGAIGIIMEIETKGTIEATEEITEDLTEDSKDSQDNILIRVKACPNKLPSNRKTIDSIVLNNL